MQTDRLWEALVLTLSQLMESLISGSKLSRLAFKCCSDSLLNAQWSYFTKNNTQEIQQM